jgi:hypothetical protein
MDELFNIYKIPHSQVENTEIEILVHNSSNKGSTSFKLDMCPSYVVLMTTRCSLLLILNSTWLNWRHRHRLWMLGFGVVHLATKMGLEPTFSLCQYNLTSTLKSFTMPTLWCQLMSQEVHTSFHTLKTLRQDLWNLTFSYKIEVAYHNGAPCPHNI